MRYKLLTAFAVIVLGLTVGSLIAGAAVTGRQYVSAFRQSGAYCTDCQFVVQNNSTGAINTVATGSPTTVTQDWYVYGCGGCFVHAAITYNAFQTQPTGYNYTVWVQRPCGQQAFFYSPTRTFTIASYMANFYWGGLLLDESHCRPAVFAPQQTPR
jgi:hypothetical protein